MFDFSDLYEPDTPRIVVVIEKPPVIDAPLPIKTPFVFDWRGFGKALILAIPFFAGMMLAAMFGS